MCSKSETVRAEPFEAIELRMELPLGGEGYPLGNPVQEGAPDGPVHR
jgi:hypothetical protein